MTYNVAIPAGTRVQLSLEDATGDEAWSGNVNLFLDQIVSLTLLFL